MKKSSVLALAIAGIVAAPIASAEVYVSARVGVDVQTHDDSTALTDDGANRERTEFGNLSSRLGWRGETDLGNGLTAFGKLEVAADGFGLRDLHAGLAGDFGKVIIGERLYAAFYNHVTGPIDPTYWVGGQGFVQTGRTYDVITYQGGGDVVSFEVSVEADGTDSTSTDGETGITGYQGGVSIGLGDNWTVAAAFRNAEDSAANATNEDVIGATVYGTIGNIYLAGSFQQDDDLDGITLHAAFGSFFVDYGSLDSDAADATPTSIAVGYSASIGENTSWWIEAVATDADDTGPDSEEIVAALRFDF
jgi:predicted porin